MIKDSDRQVRLKAAQLLRIMGRDAKAAIPALIEAFKDPDVYVRAAAISAVGAMGPDTLPALAALREALRDEEFLGVVAAAAAVTIGQLGESAKPAVPDLIALLPRRGKEGTMLGTLASLGALKNLGPVAAEAIPAVIETLNESRDSTVRAQCLRVLVKAGPAARQDPPPRRRFPS
jgi:HEAT repeat protein